MELKPTEQFFSSKAVSVYISRGAASLYLKQFKLGTLFSWTILTGTMDRESRFSVLPDTNLNGSFPHTWIFSYMWEALHIWKSAGGWEENWRVVALNL